MTRAKTDGNCYICGKQLGKTAMKNHILKEHSSGDEECFLLAIEGLHAKQYWLLVDMPKNKSLEMLDMFLRRIWLECCGHMSAFNAGRYSEIGKTRKLSAFSKGDKIIHEYDMGSTTESLISFAGETLRPKQKDAARLLARNIEPIFECASCDKPAVFVCQECLYSSDSPFYCKECAENHEHDEMFLPITNSPRNGECGYDGEFDTFAFIGPGMKKEPAGQRSSGRR